MDLPFLLIIAALFGVTVALVYGCERMRGRQ